jgi:plastocyanin
MKKLFAVLLFLTAVLFIGASCTKQPDVPDSGLADIKITAKGFEPDNLVISRGSVIKWTNYDSAKHQIKSDALPDFSSGVLEKGNKFAYTFTAPGTWHYYCNLNLSLKGSITVK